MGIINSREEAINSVLNGLQYLIMTAGASCARQQYWPDRDSDSSDDMIKAQRQFFDQMRIMRDNFEEVLTGLLL